MHAPKLDRHAARQRSTAMRDGVRLAQDPAQEREADRMAQGAGSRLAARAARGGPPIFPGGRPLDPEVSASYGRRFDFDFSRVRIHTDDGASRAASLLGAQAFTVGNEIAFAPGQFQIRTPAGRELLGHELAHVVQQARAPMPSIQARLVAVGDPAGFVRLANSIIAVQHTVSVDATGLISLTPTQVQGPPTPAQAELVSVLQTVIGDSRTTTIDFIHGTTSTRASDASVIVGSYRLGRIDLDDIGRFGGAGARGLNAGTALAHEILEQYRKQIHGESYPVAHAAGLASEARAADATITPGPLRQVNATTIEIVDIYRYRDGTREEVTITITNGNVTNVARRMLP